MHHFVSRVSATARGGMPARALATAFDAVVFDKDGTLLDFAATWNPAIYEKETLVSLGFTPMHLR